MREQNNNNNKVKSILVNMENFSAYWNNNTAIVKNIQLKVKIGDFICIVGKIGSSKSSLLYSILQEIPKYSG
jgi:ATP-binding cassette subfamily C (CFTR/MRP) protein 4